MTDDPKVLHQCIDELGSNLSELQHLYRQCKSENIAWREQMKALAPALRDLLQMIEKIP